MKKIQLDLQILSKEKNIPSRKNFLKWIGIVFKDKRPSLSHLIIRIVNRKEIFLLNEKYRHKKKVTNVLSFEEAAIPGFKKESLGELVICAPIIFKEAKAQHKTIESHWAHIVIHGVLHLLGDDHEKKSEAKKMESLEIKLLKQLGIENPYKL